MGYEYRSSDLDFALFLTDLTPEQVIPERWHEPHPQRVVTQLFAHTLADVEALVSEEVLEVDGRRARFRNGTTKTAAKPKPVRNRKFEPGQEAVADRWAASIEKKAS